MKNIFTQKLRIQLLLFSFFVFITSWSFATPVIQKKDSNEGRIESIHLGKTYVSGRLFRVSPYHTTPGAHVDVLVLDTHGRVIERGFDRLPSMMPKKDAHQRYSSYKVSLAENFLGAGSIQVIYVSTSHSLCHSIQ
ncbi:MAG: hypothetical protein V4507_09820 [Verrucomicrobiota bacterium]